MLTATATLHLLGAAGTVTGSRFLLDTGRSRVLVDCGLFQGRKDLRLRNWAPFPVDPASIDAVVLTHAHLDHIGYLPALARDGFRGPVWCTQSTATLARILLADSAHLQEEEAAYANRKGFSKHRPALPLYTGEDAEAALELLRPVGYGETTSVADDVQATLRPAGHILGSATVTLQVGATGPTLLFTGDLGRPQHPLLVPPAPPLPADVVVTEATYGDRSHGDDGEALEVLATNVTRTVARGGTVIIPAFAVDRTEVVLVALARLAAQGLIPHLPIHVDSPMALAVLDVYRDAIDRRSPEIRPEVDAHVFEQAGILREIATVEESRALNDAAYPSIIVSASGMASGGRVLHHLAHRLPDPRATVLFVGFQAPGTRGQALVDGAPSVRMHGRDVPVRADIVHVGGFSVHADGGELIDWLGTMASPPQEVLVVHGETEPLAAMRDRITGELGWPATVPAQLDAHPISVRR